MWRWSRSKAADSSAVATFARGVRLTQISGSGNGKVVEFPAAREEILVGRDEHWADFALPQSDRMASRRHLRIRRQADGEWEVSRFDDKYVDVGGRKVLTRARLRDGDVLALGHGQDGPKLRFEFLALTQNERTDLSEWAKGITDDRRRKVRPLDELFRGLRRHVAVVTTCLAVAVVGGWYGLSHLSGQVNELAQFQEALTQEEARAREQPADWSDWAETLSAAAHVVVVKRGDLEWALATAWPVSPTRMVTNAHVAAELAGRDDLEVFVRSPGGRQTFRVSDMTIHPAYEPFRSFVREEEIGTRTPDGFRRVQLPGAYDLAILELEPGSNAGPVLRVLPPEEAGELRVGQRIAFAGYFLRGVEGGERAHLDPVPRVHFGEISARTNFLMRFADDGQSRLIHNNIPITGGTSGGPVIDERGRVIAVISSGTVVSVPPPAGAEGQVAAATRVPSAALVNYAQRADLLHHFLDDAALFDVAAERATYWEPELASFATYGDYIRAQFLADIANRDTRDFLPEREPVHLEVERGYDVRTFTLDLEAGRGYAIMAYSHGSEAVQLRLDDAGADERVDRGHPARLVFTARQTGPVELALLTSNGAATSIELFIYRTD